MKKHFVGLGACLFLALTLAQTSGAWSMDPGVPVVFARRATALSADNGSVVPRGQEGQLVVLENGVSTRVLVDGSAASGVTDVSDPDVSWDGGSIVFGGFSQRDGAWRIFEVKADGTGLRQVTTSDRRIDLARYGSAAGLFEVYDDTDPCYLPDGRICFVSTRYPGFAPGPRARTTNLHVVNADGTNTHRITSERFGADTPAVGPDGKIYYSRWWLSPHAISPPPGGFSPDRPPAYYGPVINVNNFSTIPLRGIEEKDFQGVNNWFIASINPDGSDMSMQTGYGLDRELTMAYRPAFLANGSMVSLFIRESPVLGVPAANGVRRANPLPALPTPMGGPQSFTGSAILRDPAAPVRDFREPAFVYANVQPLPDGKMLMTARGADKQDFGIYVQEGSRAPVLVLDTPGVSELDAVALASRPVPPKLEDRAPLLTGYDESPLTVEEATRRGGTFTFKVENIFANAPVGNRIAHAPPLGRNLTIEFYMNPQRDGTLTPDEPILIGSQKISHDGKVEMELPAGVPLFEVLRRPDDLLALGRDGQVFHVGSMNFGTAGAVARCVGCHAGHSMQPVAADPAWTNHAPNAIVTASSVRSDPNAVGFFSPALVVDRLTDPLVSEWAAAPVAAGDEAPHVGLRWIQPISAREVVIHGPAQGTGFFGARNLVINAVTVTTLLAGELVESRRVASTIAHTGTSIAWDPARPFDELLVSIAPADTSGLYENAPTPALAEIEVIAQPLGNDPPTYLVTRGDVNCDGPVNTTDAILILDRLFRGGARFCCEDAADVSWDGLLNITDPVYLLSWLFRGADPFAGSDNCLRVTGSPLSCEQETCN